MLRELRRTIGQNIHTARLKHKMPLKKLARVSGDPEEKLDQYELGKSEISLHELVRIACAIDANPLSLMESFSKQPL
ncbi:XRE family transcriptional regulator [Mesorhizobium denitrificans]|uniref:XRE family transcriptional regulator n=2 Tax=Phyllobacteriaceae TaxID=69277 RepID=A0A371XC74_9HYPH|nr:XRE family transcriptional regulator [Mesorhizobium denitrificans]